jgi:branched-chain amino acid transport system permease protein
MSAFVDSHTVLIQATFTSLLLALSIQVPLRMGVFSFGGAASYGLGGYAAAIAAVHFNWNTESAICFGVLLGVLSGLILALLLQRLNGLYLGMATIAADLIISVVATNGGTLTGGALGLYGVIAKPPLTLLAIVVVTVIVVALLAISERGPMGRRIQAVANDHELAASVGIRVSRYRVAAFVVSGALGALGGAMNVLLTTTIGPGNLSFSLVVLALTMIIVGGTGSWLGAAIGAIIFTWLPDLLSFVDEWQAIIYGVIVALAAILMPGGIVGVWTKSWRALRRPALLRALDGSSEH